LWQNGARVQQREVLFVNSSTWAVKYLVQFSIWNRRAKNLSSIHDSIHSTHSIHELVKYVRKKNKKNFCGNGACWKSFHFSMKNDV